MKSGLRSIRPLLFLLFLLSAPILSAQQAVLSVRGEARLYTTPELLQVQVPLQAKDASYKSCNEALTSSYNALKAALQKAGIPGSDIRAHNVQVRENVNWSRGDRKVEGFVGSMQLRIEMPHTTQLLNAFMQTMSKEEFSFGYSIQFALSESQKDKLRDEALEKAVQDAREKAETLAKSLGQRLIGIKSVEYRRGAQGQHPLMRYERASMSADMEEVELNPSEQEIQEAVDIEWFLSP